MLQIKVLVGFWTFWIYPKPLRLEQSILISTLIHQNIQSRILHSVD